MDLSILLLAGLSVILAAFGFGLSLIAAPVVALLDPSLMPAGCSCSAW
jgi:hypothetical protein